MFPRIEVSSNVDLHLLLAGEVDMLWQFGDPKLLDNWVVTADSDHNEGFSSCELVTSPVGKVVFRGNLCTRVPKDGKNKNSGYCNIRSKRVRVSVTLHSIK